MKKRILTAGIVALLAVSTFAQDAFNPAGFKDNWFIQLQGGVNYGVNEDHNKASVSDLLAPHFALGVGKYFYPEFGVRLQFEGIEAKGYYAYKKFQEDYKLTYYQANADALVNLTNLFIGYRENRMFNLVGIAGLGFAYRPSDDLELGGLTYQFEKSRNIVPRVGLQGDFKVSKTVSLNLELMANLYSDNFSGLTGGVKQDGLASAMVGATYRFGGEKFTSDVYDDLHSMNNQLNAMRSEVDGKNRTIRDLEAQLAVVPEPQIIEKEVIVEKPGTGGEVLNAVVVFVKGSARLENNQEINIYNAARFLQENPTVSVVVTGHADKQTGSAAINQKISEQRAEAVAKVLINKYGISPSRIIKRASGDKEQLFPTPDWNRVVVFTIADR